MKKFMALVCAALLLATAAVPATADVFDKINGFLDKVNDKIGAAAPSVATPGIVPSGTVLAASKDPSYTGYGDTPSGNPETGLSLKALEAMALLGDNWAKMKVDEINAQKFYQAEQARYDSISWFNIFKKIGALTDKNSAKKRYEQARETVAKYEAANPNAGKIVNGIDQVNESVLEVKALFGNKEAKAQLEMLRAKREFDRLTYQYENAGFFEKMKLKNDLDYAKRRYELAAQTLAQVTGKKAASAAPVATTTAAKTIAASTAAASTVSTPGDNAAVSFAKQQNQAAYQRYTVYLNCQNPDPAKLQLMKQEYEMTQQELNRLQGK